MYQRFTDENLFDFHKNQPNSCRKIVRNYNKEKDIINSLKVLVFIII